jgi:hypothetical protein
MKPRIVSHWLAAALFLTVMSANPAHAQAVANALISGVVTDPTGATVQDAKIIATQTNTNAVRTVQSGADGTFILPGLAIGPYKLQAEAKGFTTYVQTGIVLQVGESPSSCLHRQTKLPRGAAATAVCPRVGIAKAAPAPAVIFRNLRRFRSDFSMDFSVYCW